LLNLAGLSCAALGQNSEALRFFTQLVNAVPNDPTGRQNRIQTLLAMGDTKRARADLATALSSWPQHPALLQLNVNAQIAAADYAAARDAVDAAIKVSPTSAALFALRARIALAADNSANATTDLEMATQLAPNNADFRLQYAELLVERAEFDAARSNLDLGLRHAPNHIGLTLLDGRLNSAMGQTEAAIAAYRRVLDHFDGHPIALNALAYLVDATQAADLLEPLKTAADAEKRGSPTHILLTFALARVERTLNTAQASERLTTGNRLAAKAMPYDPKIEAAEHDRILTLSDALETAERATGKPTPVFVVGLIRSGTSLCEQVLSAHPAIAGLGELNHMGEAVRAALHGETSDTDLPEAYLRALPALPDGTAAFVDKMPENFRFVGPILRAFPDAVIIEMQRDPRDVALSMWENLFPTTAHAYSNDFTRMALHMNHYARVMSDWRARYEGRIHSVQYSDLVADIDGTSRRLADLCGVAWDRAMTSPQDVVRPVLTASIHQVRAPVHSKSLGRWQGQSDLLKPLTDALDPDLWGTL